MQITVEFAEPEEERPNYRPTFASYQSGQNSHDQSSREITSYGQFGKTIATHKAVVDSCVAQNNLTEIPERRTMSITALSLYESIRFLWALNLLQPVQPFGD